MVSIRRILTVSDCLVQYILFGCRPFLPRYEDSLYSAVNQEKQLHLLLTTLRCLAIVL